MTICYIGLGSNLATPLDQLLTAIEAIKALKPASGIKVSSFYASKPMGPQDQPEYVNAVLELSWSSTAIDLLDGLQLIEQNQGRVRKAERWGPRTLDLDIILFGNEVINSERLIVPHYGMQQREFVLYPLQELNPKLILPCHTPLKNLILNCPLNDLIKISQ